MRFYVATSFTQKARADRVADYLIAQGLEQTLRWTGWRESAPGYAVGLEGAPTPLWVIAQQEIEAIAAADVLVVLQPIGLGSHVELGAALAARKPVVLVGTDWDPFNPFYRHPSVFRQHESPDEPGGLERLHNLLMAIAMVQARTGAPA